MSFLYPLFLAGMAAVGLPILLHLIQRYTRQRVSFSSLMFLHASPPRFERKRRLQNLPLLLLRCLIVCLLAAAFARPFFGEAAAERQVTRGRALVLLLDTSASMRRTGLWDQLVDAATEVLADVKPQDSVCVMSFDRGVDTLIGFTEWETVIPDQRNSMVREHIARLSPTWACTNLDQALIRAVETLEEIEPLGQDGVRPLQEIVLISDLQQGCRLEALHAYEWPEGVSLVLKPVTCSEAGNAAMQLVVNRNDPGKNAADSPLDLRISNAGDAVTEQFKLQWGQGSPSDTSPEPTEVYTAPSHSTLLPIPPFPEGSSARVVTLSGDPHDFDNQLFIAAPGRYPIRLLYLGQNDPSDPQGMLYYLRRAYRTAHRFQVQLDVFAGDAPLLSNQVRSAHLVIVTDRLSKDNAALLRQAMESGKMVWLLLHSDASVLALKDLVGLDGLATEKASVDQYAMLGQLDFSHPLLMPFSEPHLGDFTRIHFWAYRRLDPQPLADFQVLARFDSGDPAWLEQRVGKGRLLMWTAGWDPANSDFALSSKFVPLLFSILHLSGALDSQESQYFVGDRVTLPSDLLASTDKAKMRKPDGEMVSITGDQATFTQTDTPGLYRMDAGDKERVFAVNLLPREGRTAVLAQEDLEKLGLPLTETEQQTDADSAAMVRRQNLAQLESSQQVWRKLLAVLFVVLLMEIALGGWIARRGQAVEGTQA